MSESCATCSYMRPSSGTHNNAERHVGRPIIDRDGRGVWPIVYPSEWCGEYRQRAEESASEPTEPDGMREDGA